jgi:glycosyltransferase involved in cell wall biosynthesis
MTEQIRVLDIITTAQGGKRLLEYRAAAVNRDPDFINFLACPEEAFFTGEFAARGIHFEPFPMSRGLSPLSIIRETGRFLKLIKGLNVSVVHAHTSKAGAIARLGCALYNFCRKERIYVTYQVHSFYFNTQRGIKRTIFLRLEQLLSRFSDSLLFQNEHEKEQGEKYGMDKRALLINIGNGINLSEFTGAGMVRTLPEWVQKDPETARYRAGKPFVIICIARVEPKKHHHMLVDAAALLSRQIGDLYGEETAKKAFRILCVGEIGEQEVIDYTLKQGMGSLITFTGVKNRAEVAALLAESHLSVLTSTAEGKPRALMESMNMGIPCVATDVYGTKDVIDNGKNGFLVPLDDTAAFTAAILRLMREPELYRTFSENSITKAQEEFDENAVITRLKKIYREKPRRRKSPGDPAKSIPPER